MKVTRDYLKHIIRESIEEAGIKMNKSDAHVHAINKAYGGKPRKGAEKVHDKISQIHAILHGLIRNPEYEEQLMATGVNYAGIVEDLKKILRGLEGPKKEKSADLYSGPKTGLPVNTYE